MIKKRLEKPIRNASPRREPLRLTEARRPQRMPEETNVLVINSSHEMAKEITLQLTLAIPGCAITYAPSLELARWMLSRRRIHLVVSSHILPDGSVTRLKGALEQLEKPPHVVVVGDLSVRGAEEFGRSGYEFAAVRRMGGAPTPRGPVGRTHPKAPDSIKDLGADLRNDLNNPLQEIVAMVFVAQASRESSQATSQALDAIDKAAKNMAKVVNDLETKIREAVTVKRP